MTPLGWVAIIAGLVAGGVAIWFITPTWQCPVCHSYKVEEYTHVETGDYLACKECGAEWKAL